jgi:hypothetical protein
MTFPEAYRRKTKKYLIVRTFSKFNRKIVERCKMDTSEKNTGLTTYLAWHRYFIKLVLLAQTYPLK